MHSEVSRPLLQPQNTRHCSVLLEGPSNPSEKHCGGTTQDVGRQEFGLYVGHMHKTFI